MSNTKPDPAEAAWRGHIVVGDARNLNSLLPGDCQIDATITSPPYADVVDYGVPEQIGYGQTYEDYLHEMASIFATLWGRTKATGSMWLIVDTVHARTSTGITKVVPVPFDLTQAAEGVGWTLCDIAIWRKDRTLPWSSPGRLRNAFEYVLFFAKSAHYKYHLDAARTIDTLEGWWQSYPERYSPLGMAPTNVWDFPIPIQGSWSDGLLRHACPLPQGLVRRIIDIATDPGDLVCDPFAGVGTVPAVAAVSGRSFFGVELNPESVEQFYTAVLPATHERYRSDANHTSRIEDFGDQIAYLRHAKFTRAVARSLRDLGMVVPALVANAQVQVRRLPQGTSVGLQVLTLYCADEELRDRAADHIRRITKTPPLSKYGIAAEVRTADPATWSSVAESAEWSEILLDRRQAVPYEGNGQLPRNSMLVLVNVSATKLQVSR